MKTPARIWTELSDRDRRALRWGVLVLAPVLAWGLVVSPWLDAVQARGDRLETRRSLHRAGLDLLASGEAFPEAVRTGARRLAGAAPRLLDSRGEGVAAAGLTQYVEDRARAARVHLTGTEPRPPRPVHTDLTAIPLEVTGESDLRGILSFLEALEGEHGQLLRVEGLRIRAAGAGRDGGAEALAFRVLVTGHMLSPGVDGSPDTTAAAAEAPGAEAGP